MKPEDFGDNGRFQVGRVVGCASVTYEALRTEPPSRYTQSDLIDEMMAAHKFAQSEKDRELLRSIAGLGTSRTREATITGLIDRHFLVVEKAKRSRSRVELKPSEMAMTIISHMPKMLTDPATTAKWELAFQMIEQGKAQLEHIEGFFRSTLNVIVDEAKGKVGQVSVNVPGKAAAGTNHFSKTPAKGGNTKAAASAA